MTFPTVTLKVHPFCNHPKPDRSCKYCVDAEKVYRELLKMQEKTKFNLTKVAVIAANDGTKEPNHV